MATYRTARALLWLIPFAVVELFLYLSYGEHDAATHWLTHFLVGASTAFLLMSLYVRRTRRLPAKPLMWVLAAHLFAMAPDVMFNNFSIPHAWWMEVFLAHISSHFIPGRNWTWVAVFSITLGIFLWTVDQCVAGRVSRRSSAEVA